MYTIIGPTELLLIISKKYVAYAEGANETNAYCLFIVDNECYFESELCFLVHNDEHSILIDLRN